MKRRKLHILTLILLLQTIICLTGKSQDIDYFAIFNHLNPDSIPTGILYDKCYPTSKVLQFNGSDSISIADTMIMTKKEWNKIYSELLMAYVDSVTIPKLYDIRDTLDLFYKQQMIPIYIVNMEYNRIKDNAIDDNLLAFTNDQLYDVPNPPESPYLTSRYFSALALPLNLNGEDFIFKLDSSLYISNTDDTIQSIDIDFGNDLLFTGLNLNSEITINRSELIDTAKLIVHLQKDSILVCKFEIKTDNNHEPNLKSAKVALTSSSICNYVFPPVKSDLGDGFVYGAKFGVLFGCKTTSFNEIKKPIIIVEGWDPTNDRDLDRIYAQNNVEWEDDYGSKHYFIEELQNRGYDVILMDYDDGGDAIQGNASVLRKFLIENLNPILLKNNSNNKIVIMGESMGGLVSRYALANMESIGEDHNTKLFLTMDTPNQGAYVSYAIQHLGNIAFDIISLLDKFGVGLSDFIKDGELVKQIEVANKMFNAMASKQMLVYYRPDCKAEHPAPSPARTNLLNEFNSFGNNGFPTNVDKMVAFSFGSGKGYGQGFAAGATRYSFEGPQEIDGIYLDKVSFTLKAIPDQVSENILNFSIEKKMPAPCIKWLLLKLLCGHGIILRIDLIDLTVHGTLPYENAPGGHLDIATKSIVGALDELFKTDYSSTIGTDCFVPTISSLNLNNVPLNFNVHENFPESTQGSNYYEMNDHSITPYDAFYIEDDNKEHGPLGTTPDMMEKALNLIVGDDDLLLKNKFIVNKKEQYEAGNSITLDNVHVSSLPLFKKSLLSLRAGQTITIEKDFSVGKNCTFEVITQGVCE